MPDGTPRRKLLFYTPSLGGGGAERVWVLLASAFHRRGHDVSVVVDSEETDNAMHLDSGVPVIVLGHNHVLATLALARLIRRDRPDVCLSAISIANLKLTLAATATGRLSRTILSYHGYAVAEPQPLSRISYALTPVLTRLTGATVAVSRGLQRYLVEERRATARRVAMIYNPVLTDALATPTAEALRARAKVVLSVGRLVDYKGVDTLIRAFARVDHPAATLVILGEGPDRAALETLVRSLGLDQRVSLPGYEPAPWQHYAEARCFVLPSRTEAFGNVIVEALAAGLPVISTDCGGPAEILEDGLHGAIVPIDDEAAMAAAITAALDDPGDPAPRRARAEDFRVDHAVDRYERLIEDVIRQAD